MINKISTILLLTFLFAVVSLELSAQTVTYTPTTFGCGTTTLTIEYPGCAWGGVITPIALGGLPPGVSFNQGSALVTTGVATIDITVDANVSGSTTFDLEVTTVAIFTNMNPGGCMTPGFQDVVTLTAVCGPIDPIITPTILDCSTSVTIDYGCDWTGDAGVGFPNGLPTGVTYTGSAPIPIINGVGTTSFDVAPGTSITFDWDVSIGFIFSNPGGCNVTVGDLYTETMYASCGAIPTLCLKDVVDAIVANGGMTVGEIAEFIAADTDTYFGVDGGDGIFNVNIFQNSVNVNGFASIVQGDTIKLEAVSVGSDQIASDFGNCTPLPNVNLVVSPALPVTWLQPLRATKSNNHVELTWSVAQQLNNDQFIIEHSIDGSSFNPIGSVNGDGNLLEEKAFDYVHEHPLHGINYYRLKQVDFDGGYEYSNVVSVSMTSDRPLQVYPNPTSDFITITIQGDQNVQIFDGFGELKMSVMVSNSMQLDIQELPSGVYYIRTESGDLERFVKM